MTLRLNRAVGVLTLMAAVLCSSCSHQQCADWGCFQGKDCSKAKVCDDPSMRALAGDLDHLEEMIEKHGSIIAKVPDVWGEARLTKYREEFETEMLKNLSLFEETLQGRMAFDDQAFLVNAFALNAAISGPVAVRRVPPRTALSSSTAAPSNTTEFNQVIEVPAEPTKGPTTSDGKTQPALDQLLTLPAFEKKRISEQVPLFTAGLTKDPKQLAISLEPSIVLEQKARYLNCLNQIRRTNEGDDTSDAPGYALHLVRIPISVLPGKSTDTGHGAEVSITMSAVLGDELLPTTFRNLVINDLVDQIGFSLTAFLNDKKDVETYLTPEVHKLILDTKVEKDVATVNLPADVVRHLPDKTVTTQNTVVARKAIKEALREELPLPVLGSTKFRNARLPFPPSQILDVYGVDFAYHIAYDANLAMRKDPANREFVHLPDVKSYLREEMTAAYKFLSDPTNRDLWDYCTRDLARLVHTRNEAELDRLRQEFRQRIFRKLEPSTASNFDWLRSLGASNFAAYLLDILDSFEGKHPSSHSTTTALAWAVLVESALLNHQLVEDMRETASAKGASLSCEWQDYFLPIPAPEARKAFNEYVRCRWPIHVFALDPMTQDQNIADSFTRRRELQLAMSLAFVSGNMSARNLTRYARRLDAEYDTIALNRTAVGFSHGEDTFGWRFYPRYQTPDVEGNFTVLTRDLFIGGPSKESDLRQRKLEPGMRDCVAIVLMPSFVPYVTCDVSSNWFGLTNPRSKLLDTTRALRLSRTIKGIQDCGCNVQDSDCYRDGDLPRLMRRAEQLAARLPLQTLTAQVPYENTLGGFQMFNSGFTDLAPELYGWYGAPGINVAKETSLFLVGDHFNVKQTRVVVGGLAINPNAEVETKEGVKECIKRQELLSRQVVRVTIPQGAAVLATPTGEFVEVQIATPYGVTQRLLVPAVRDRPAKTPPLVPVFAWVPTELELVYAYNEAGGIQRPVNTDFDRPNRERGIRLQSNVNLDSTTADITLQFDAPFNAIEPVTLKDVPVESGRAFVIKGEKFDELARELFKPHRFGSKFRKASPPTDVVVARTSVGVTVGEGKDKRPIVFPYDVTGNLTIKWVPNK